MQHIEASESNRAWAAQKALPTYILLAILVQSVIKFLNLSYAVVPFRAQQSNASQISSPATARPEHLINARQDDCRVMFTIALFPANPELQP